jgi:signal transduction histidine kinase
LISLKKLLLTVAVTSISLSTVIAQDGVRSDYHGSLVQSVVLWLVVTGVFLVMVILMALELYRVAQSRERALDIIKTQKAELERTKEELQELNENQERTIDERTRDVIKQSEKILEYAHINAHSLRGPLARVLGLVNLINKAEDPDEIKDMVKRLDVSAHELDGVVRDINKRLNEEYGDPEEAASDNLP